MHKNELNICLYTFIVCRTLSIIHFPFVVSLLYPRVFGLCLCVQDVDWILTSAETKTTAVKVLFLPKRTTKMREWCCRGSMWRRWVSGWKYWTWNYCFSPPFLFWWLTRYKECVVSALFTLRTYMWNNPCELPSWLNLQSYSYCMLKS